MKLDVPLRELGPIAIDELRAAILAQGEDAWTENVDRQNNYEVHQDTKSIVLVFCDSQWPQLTVTREAGWSRLSQQAVPIIDELIRRAFPPGGTVIRAMAACLVAGGRITPHFDAHVTFKKSHRIHVPITTNPRVRFMIDGRPYQLEVGKAYELNNQETHSVMNSGVEDRINFIFDYLPPQSIAGRVAEPVT